MGYNQTHAVQQAGLYSLTSSARASILRRVNIHQEIEYWHILAPGSV